MTETTPNHTQTVEGWACLEKGGKIVPYVFKRRSVGVDDVQIKIIYCGMCHGDLQYIKNDFGDSKYPMVPGYEIAGVVTHVGAKVTEFKVGDRVGVGCLGASCLECELCLAGEENYCANVQFIYNGISWDGSINYGGWSKMIVAHQRFVVKMPENLPMYLTAPLLCAGIVVFSPMKQHGMLVAGKRIGVVGLGGIGHLAVKFGKAYGCHVTVISTSLSKENEAKRLGADSFLVSKNEAQMQAAARSLDYIVDTVSGPHSMGPLLDLLKVLGTLVLVGCPDVPVELPAFPLIFGKRFVSGSLLGGMKHMKEMMEASAKYKVTADVEVIKPDYINQALERLERSAVKYRFVVDIAGEGENND